MQDTPSEQPSPTALVLTGGGARAAYQVGALRAINEFMPPYCGNPFSIICGTSAGGLNAVGLAVNAACFGDGVAKLEEIWGNFSCDQVFRTDWPGVLDSAFRWLTNLAMGMFNRAEPVSLLNNAPLAALLAKTLNLKCLPSIIESGHLRALCITACSYSRGDSTSFYQGSPDLEDWHRARRRGIKTNIEIEHLMASAAIPLLFPSVRINNEYYGDGALRQLAPVSPALHLGARRILVIGSGRGDSTNVRRMSDGYPSLAQILGHIMNSSFIDSLEMDLERMSRINKTLGLLTPEQLAAHTTLRPVEHLVLSPSVERLEELASRYAHELPRSIRLFVRGSGMFKRAGSNLLSYLLFERSYTRAVMQLGYEDARERELELRQFLQPELAPHSNILSFQRPIKA